MPYNANYGNYRNLKFTDIFEDQNTFMDAYNDGTIPALVKQDDVKTLYYLLYARYGNSTIASFDETQFKYKLFSIVYMYGPTWSKKLEIQAKLRNLSEDEMLIGAKQIANHAYNPGTEPSTATLEELTQINEQNTSTYKKSKLDGYGLLLGLLENDVTEEFISKFKKLFLTVVQPEKPLYYWTEEEEND